MRFRRAEDADALAWQSVVEGHDSGDFLHDWQWAQVSRFDGQPQERFVVEQDGRLRAAIAVQVRRLALGGEFWYVPHGPVMDWEATDSAAVLGSITDGLAQAGRDRRAVAVRIEPRLERESPHLALLDDAGLRRVPGHLQVGWTRIVELGSDEEMLAAMERNTRYEVRRSMRKGVVVNTTSDPSDDQAIAELCELYEITQRRAGFPLRPLERFRLAWRLFAAAGRAWIMRATIDGRLLAGGMLIIEGGQSFYFMSGSVRDELKLYAGHTMQWAMMQHARDHGVRRHDLWGIPPPDAGPDHPWAGVGMHKKGFGGNAVGWAGMWDLVVDERAYRLREAAQPLTALLRRARGGR